MGLAKDQLWREGRMADPGCLPAPLALKGRPVISIIGVIFSTLLKGKLRLREVVPAQACPGNRWGGGRAAQAVPWTRLLPPPPLPEQQLVLTCQVRGSLAWRGVNTVGIGVQRKERCCAELPAGLDDPPPVGGITVWVGAYDKWMLCSPPRDLAPKDRNGASDPFVRVRYSGRTQETSVRGWERGGRLRVWPGAIVTWGVSLGLGSHRRGLEKWSELSEGAQQIPALLAATPAAPAGFPSQPGWAETARVGSVRTVQRLPTRPSLPAGNSRGDGLNPGRRSGWGPAFSVQSATFLLCGLRQVPYPLSPNFFRFGEDLNRKSIPLLLQGPSGIPSRLSGVAGPWGPPTHPILGRS